MKHNALLISLHGDAEVPPAIICDLLRHFVNPTEEEEAMAQCKLAHYNWDAKGRWWNKERTGKGTDEACNEHHKHMSLFHQKHKCRN